MGTGWQVFHGAKYVAEIVHRLTRVRIRPPPRGCWAAAGISEGTAVLRPHTATSGQMVGEEGELEEPYFRKLPTKPAYVL